MSTSAISCRSACARGIAKAAVAAGFALTAAAGAHAADLGGRIKEPAPYYEPAPRFSWTGFYLGANFGGAWANGGASYDQTGVNVLSGDWDSASVIGGGQIGYNWQAGSLVVSIEADIAAQNLSSSIALANQSLALTHENRWVGTLRPRVGYAMGNVLLYVTGGLAFGSNEHRIVETSLLGPTRTGTHSEVRTGWTVGAGIEWALNRNWTLGAEYLHIDLGEKTGVANAVTVGGVTFPAATGRFEDSEDIIRAKLNYKF